MRRREFITLLGGFAACPVIVRAQQSTMPVVGFIAPASAKAFAQPTQALLRGLSDQGFSEGRNVRLVFAWGDDQNDRLPGLAADLIRRSVNVIVAAGIPAILAAKEAAGTVPIVFNTGEDPVKLGLVASLNRPGANITGVTLLGGELGAKRIELLHELLPDANAVATLINPTNPIVAEAQIRHWQLAAKARGIALHVLHATTEEDFEPAFANMRALKLAGLVIGSDSLTISRSRRLAELSLRHGTAAIFQFRPFVEAGGLMSYGADIADSFRQTGVYAGRILSGEKPADLPVQQSTKIEMIINLKTAKTLGINLPLTLLGRADEVIE
jgi:putative ABC transport system substrate-binding protein